MSLSGPGLAKSCFYIQPICRSTLRTPTGSHPSLPWRVPGRHLRRGSRSCDRSRREQNGGRLGTECSVDASYSASGSWSANVRYRDPYWIADVAYCVSFARQPAAEATRLGSSFWSLAPSGALLDRARDSRLSYRKWVGARCCGSRGPTAARHSSCAWARACSRGRRFWGREAARRGSPAEGLWQGADAREGGGAGRCIGANRKDASNPRWPQAHATWSAWCLPAPP